jgi:hypothetical protein
MRGVITVVLALLALPSHAEELVGREVPPYPAGLENLIGSCIGDTAKGEDICAWSIGTLNAIGSGVAIGVFAGRSLGNAPDGTARWLVTGYLTLPAPKEGYEVQIGMCRRSGVEDQSIVAVARLDPDKEYSDDVTWAAEFDRASGALAEMPTAGIDCANIGM